MSQFQAEVHADGARAVLIQDVKKGDFVRRTADAKKVYTRGAYDASTRSYALNDVGDISRDVLVKTGTIVFIGFTY